MKPKCHCHDLCRMIYEEVDEENGATLNIVPGTALVTVAQYPSNIIGLFFHITSYAAFSAHLDRSHGRHFLL